ncbi:ParB/RepB/Spo0J family partition protein [Romboutsia lituseburensis]|uniref:ParB/RepB/Spo0J family partition protein n=1 Tax=Romboutsia lituseburensis TaxID=1537 RepID=UPI00215A88B2|nr:ParB/RepB/Spo0J family partition protein [Romboutsia lituseburensis]MCR8745890.1 ParB/RepB/Spo0J family partition protein [Romboutsia lituseburensis]
MEKKSPKRTNRLGRGLSALIPDTKDDIDSKEIVRLDLSKVYPNDTQPRKVFDEEKIHVLCESIKHYGVLQPIVVKPDEDGRYMIIAGERRYRASKMAKQKDIPAVIKDIPMKDIMEIALIENLQREDLNAIEEALAYRSLIEHYDVTQEEISEAVGKSRPHITNTLRLLNLGENVIVMVENGQLTAGHGKALLRVSDLEKQLELANKVKEEELSVRETERLAKKIVEENSDLTNKKSSSKEKDIFIVDVEEKLTNVFGTKVNISKGKKKGKIEIEYYNEDDLNNIVSMLLEENEA